MKKEKINNLIKFYVIATSLKDKIRSGWKIWHVSKARLESVAEHIYGTMMIEKLFENKNINYVDLTLTENGNKLANKFMKLHCRLNDKVSVYIREMDYESTIKVSSY